MILTGVGSGSKRRLEYGRQVLHVASRTSRRLHQEPSFLVQPGRNAGGQGRVRPNRLHFLRLVRAQVQQKKFRSLSL